MVICGGASWDFVIDKRQMARLVPLYEGISLLELEGNVLKEFRVQEGDFKVSLSYWPPTSYELATGLKTPPALLTSDGGIRYFLEHMKVRGAMNLFAKFEKVEKQKGSDHIDDSGMGCVTPAKIIRKESFVGSGVSKEACASTGVSKVDVVNLEDEEFVREVEKVEEKIKSRSKQKRESEQGRGSQSSGGTVDGSGDVDESDIRPRSYDKEFWSPLLKGDFGGSYAVDVVYNADEIVSGLTKNDGPRTYMCTTNNAFDHMVEVGGTSSGKSPKAENFQDSNPWFGNGAEATDVGSGRKPCQRKLEEIDDEEFDIPPMFDDTNYDAAEILDMDVDEDDGKIYVGKVFGSKEDCQIALAIYAIKHQFHFKQTRTKVNSFVMECPDEHCDWRVTAHEVRGCEYYEIRKAQLDHLCPYESRMGYKSKAISRVIVSVYKSKFGEPGKGPVPRELQKLVLEDLRIIASYMKCYRAKEKAVIGIRGTDEDAYSKLPEYLYMLKLANPGTVADIETEADDDGDERFLYLFLAFGASIAGFKKLRPVLVIDGTHLGGKYKGVLLTASGQDANFHIFPLAFGVVDAENEEAWTWFLQKVERILADSPQLAIVSDRASSIATAVARVYPMAHHGACIVHLARNVNSRFSSKGLAKLVTAAAMAHRPREYKELYSKIRATNSACGVYLGNIGVSHWSMAEFRGNRYNIMTSNIAEQLNKALLEGRNRTITELIMFIQRMMTRWFCARRKKAEKHRGLVSIEV